MFLKRTTVIALFCIYSYSSVAHSLNFFEAVSLAQQNDENFQIAHAEYIAIKENKSQSLSALLPEIDLDIYASDTKGKITTNSTSNNDFSSSGYSLSLSQTLFNKKLFDALDQSEAEVSQALAKYQSEKQTMLIRASTAYFNVLSAQDNLVFAQAEKQAISRQLEQSTERFNAGLIAITDVKESQAQYDISIAQEISAENEFADTKEELHVLINTYFEQLKSLDHSMPLLIPEPEDMAQWQKNAIENNLNLRAAYYAVTAASESVSGSKADHYPTLELKLSHDIDSSDGNSLATFASDRDTEDTRLSLNLNIPIYNGGSTSSKHREAVANLDKAKAILSNQKRLTAQQTRTAFRGIQAAIAQAQALKKALESTQSATEATQAGFEVGTRTSVDVLLAQREQHKSKRDYSRALYDYILNILELKQSTGTLSENDIQEISRWLTR